MYAAKTDFTMMLTPPSRKNTMDSFCSRSPLM